MLFVCGHVSLLFTPLIAQILYTINFLIDVFSYLFILLADCFYAMIFAPLLSTVDGVTITGTCVQ